MAAIITSPNAPAALGPYSHAVLAGDTLYTSRSDRFDSGNRRPGRRYHRSPGHPGLFQPESRPGRCGHDLPERGQDHCLFDRPERLRSHERPLRRAVPQQPARSLLRPGGQAAGWREDRNGSRGNQVNGLAAFRQTMRLEKLAEHPSVFFFPKNGLRNAFISLKTSYTPGCFFYNL